MKDQSTCNNTLPKITLGLFIRDKRMAARKSLRGMANLINAILVESKEVTEDSKGEKESQADTTFSAGFLSDIENGRRFPSLRILDAIAAALNIDIETLQSQDHRMPTEELQRLHALNPQFGFAFRRAVNYIQEQELTPQELLNRIYAKERKSND